jgi:hypothetical protein
VEEAEGSGEFMLQFCLQLFIIFFLGDRQPSALPLITGMDDYMRVNPLKDLKEEFSQKKNLLHLFLTITIFKLGSVAVMSANLKYWCVLCFILSFMVGFILLLLLG